jgi:hypothetical protein
MVEPEILHCQPGMEQHLAHQDEQRNRRQREAGDRLHAVARELHHAGVAAEEDRGAEQVDGKKSEPDRQAEEHQGGRAAQQQPRRGLPGHGRARLPATPP